MNISQKDKNEVIKLIRRGSEKEAHIFLQSSLSIPSKTAQDLVRSIRKDLESKYRLHTVESLKYREEIRIDKQLKRFLGGVALVGFTLISIGIYFIIQDKNFIETSVQTNGKVLKVDDDITFNYQVNGVDYEFITGSLSSDEPSYYEGEEVNMYIDASDPGKVLIDTWDERWHSISLLLIFGSILFIPGSYLSYRMIKK